MLLDKNAILLPIVIFVISPTDVKCMYLFLIFKDFILQNIRNIETLALPFIYSCIPWSIKAGKLLNHVSEMSCQAQPCITVWHPAKFFFFFSAKDTSAWLNTADFHTATSSLACICWATPIFFFRRVTTVPPRLPDKCSCLFIK